MSTLQQTPVILIDSDDPDEEDSARQRRLRMQCFGMWGISNSDSDPEGLDNPTELLSQTITIVSSSTK